MKKFQELPEEYAAVAKVGTNGYTKVDSQENGGSDGLESQKVAEDHGYHYGE